MEPSSLQYSYSQCNPPRASLLTIPARAPTRCHVNLFRSGDDEYMALLEAHLPDFVERSNPDLIFYQAREPTLHA